METRVCKKCGIEKSLSNFGYEIKNGKKYYRWKCRDCKRGSLYECIKNYREKNPEKQKEIYKNWCNENRDEINFKKREKWKNDELYKFTESMRTRVGKIFRKKGM